MPQCNLCAINYTEITGKSRIQNIPICRPCNGLEDKLVGILDTDDLEEYITFSELIVYCDMLRNDLMSEDKDIPVDDYFYIMRN
jgi:hypothetical protein